MMCKYLAEQHKSWGRLKSVFALIIGRQRRQRWRAQDWLSASRLPVNVARRGSVALIARLTLAANVRLPAREFIGIRQKIY